jgi:hypothetical protein
MEKDTCATCIKPKANLTCDVCSEPVCKKCAHFLHEDSFSFLEQPPSCVAHKTYCQHCFGENVVPQQESYNQTLEAAKNILVFYKKQSKEVRFFSKKENVIQVVDCADHDEAILRLAFRAAKSGFDAIIETEVVSKKVRTGGYQHLVWSATARPTNARRE